MEQSILNTVKKLCSMPPEYTAFDLDVITYINDAFNVLNQLGIGPAIGFQIEDASSTWSDFMPPNPLYNLVKSYICQKCRLKFDPPATSYHLKALQDQLAETEIRLNTQREYDTWVPPLETPEPEGLVLDGGSA